MDSHTADRTTFFLHLLLRFRIPRVPPLKDCGLNPYLIEFGSLSDSFFFSVPKTPPFLLLTAR